MILSESTGTWTGTNGFRLMPNDPLAEFSATVTVATAAGGHLTSVAYSWEHPDDGPQDGLIVIGSADETGSLEAGESCSTPPMPTPCRCGWTTWFLLTRPRPRYPQGRIR